MPVSLIIMHPILPSVIVIDSSIHPSCHLLNVWNRREHLNVEMRALTWGVYMRSIYDFQNTVFKVESCPHFLIQAFAEELHERVRKEFWGYDKDESFDANDLHRIRYEVNFVHRSGYSAVW